MQLVDRVPGLSSIMRATPSFLDRASIFSLYFPGKMDEYGSSDLVEGFFDGATPEDANRHELDLLVVKKMSGSIKTPIFGLSDLFGVMAIESVVEIDPLIPEVTPPFEACTMVLDVFITLVVETVDVGPSVWQNVSFDVMSGCLPYFFYDLPTISSMDMSYFECLPVCYDCV